MRLLVAFLLFSASVFAQAPAPIVRVAFAEVGYASVRLAWDANSETDLAGYKVHWGTASRTYSTSVNVPVSSYTGYAVENLAVGMTWFFAVTAYNTSGLESEFSNEVSAIIGGPPGPPGLPCVPPCIESISVSNLTQTTAYIAWSTNPECSGTVMYGLSPTSLVQTVVANNLGTTDHLAVLTGLLRRTHYNYTVAGSCNGTPISSAVRSFNTK